MKRAVLSVHKDCGNSSMIVFAPVVNDTKCTDQVQQIMAITPGFDIVCGRGAYVLYDDVNDGVYVNNERINFHRELGPSS